MSLSIANGRPRKSLADQIDRLDSTIAHFDKLLDGLADGIQSTIADSVQEAVVAAVTTALQTTLTELINNPNTRDRIVQPPPSSWIARIAAKVGHRISAVFQATRRKIKTCASTSMAGLRRLTLLWAIRRQLAFALMSGVAIGVGGFMVAPWLTAVFGGFGAAVATLFAQAKQPLRHFFGLLALE